jgi:TonB family protein
MSYKSLLFCPDERTARVVTQVLTELEFAVEVANEPFGAVKKLTEERFDALVVDCQNEQDASLLFKTARDSAQNHSSLSVAVVEGQAGVAKAFRIGANLVLTKPINVEQSKGTLRVARGLLRKNEAKPAAASTTAGVGSSVTAQPVAGSFPGALAPPIAIQAPPKPEAPFSALEVETDPIREPEAAEVALLESLPNLAGQPAVAIATPARGTKPEPVGLGSSGQAAAVAPAMEKIPILGLDASASTAPMVTNEPIVADKQYEDPLSPPVVDAPNFSSLDTAAKPSGGAKFLKIAAVFAVLATAGYFGWQKFQPLKYLQTNRAAKPASASEAMEPAASSQVTSAPAPPSASTISSTTLAPALPLDAEPTKTSSPENQISAAEEIAAKNGRIEGIEVQEMPMPGDPKPAVPKPQPLMVKPDTVSRHAGKQAQAPPTISSLNTSAAPVLPSFAGTEAALPKLAPSSVRVSQGVSQGLLLKKVPPVYPAMALQLHKQGAVEVLAKISKQGLITEVKVLNGDSMLAKAATDAVRQWKYRPYLLNGEPVEIQTQITIIFKAPK